MSLATRCTVCGTVFRVVQDQLKASEGQVRCGRCGEVFNALEGLFDLEGTSGPIPLARDISANEAPFHEAAPSPKVEAPSAKAEVVDAHDEIDEAAAVVETSDDARADTEADTQADARGESGFGRSRPRSRFDLEPVDSMVPDEALLLPQEPEASFMHAAQRKDQWQRPRARRSLLTLCVLLFVLLGTQIALHLRDRLATVWPFAAPALVSLCDLLGCSVDAPRTLDTVLVENSGLARVDGTALYRLQVTVRNRGSIVAMVPALDLTLTNLRGDIVVRRVLRAAELDPATRDVLTAGGDWPIVALLDVGDNRVAGYTVELFYP